MNYEFGIARIINRDLKDAQFIIPLSLIKKISLCCQCVLWVMTEQNFIRAPQTPPYSFQWLG